MKMEGMNNRRLRILVLLAVFYQNSIFRFIAGLVIDVFMFMRAIWYLLTNKEIPDRKDHYVPQMLLKNFAINTTSKKGLIHVYERGKQSPYEESISKKVACKPGYYLTTSRFTKEADNFVDDMMNSYLETYCRFLFKRMVSEDHVYLSNVEHNFLASFIVNLYTRTPAFRAQLIHLITCLIENNRITVGDLGNRKKFKQIIIGEEFKGDRSSLPPISSTVDITGLKNHLIVAASLVGEKILEPIFKKIVSIYKAPVGEEFIINDNPVRIIMDERRLAWPDNWDAISAETMIFIPLSKDRCLVLSGENCRFREIPIFNADRQFVERINYYTTYFADEFVYSASKSMELQDNFNMTRKLHNYSF